MPAKRPIKKSRKASRRLISSWPGAAARCVTPTSTVGETAPRFHADLVAPGHAGRNIGLAQLTFDRKGELTDQAWQRIKLGPEIVKDPAMVEWAERVKAKL